MKYIIAMFAIVASCFIGTANASETNEVQVVGVGKTIEEAKLNGFNSAIESQFGALVVTTEESRNGAMVKDEILNHSAGYVTNFTILKTTQINGLYRLTMKVTVASSAIRDRILSKSNVEKRVDGDKLVVQKQTFDRSVLQGQSLFDRVFADYPKKAYNITFKSQVFENIDKDWVALGAKFTVEWNPKWVDAFNEVMTRVRSNYQKDDLSQYAVLVHRKQNRLATWDNIDYHYFVDSKINRQLYLIFMQEAGHKVQPNPKTAYSKLSIYDAAGNEMDSVCSVLELEYNLFLRQTQHNKLPTVLIKTFAKIDDDLGIILPAKWEKLPKIASVGVSISTDDECPNK